MSSTDEFGFPLSLTRARRRLVAELIPDLADRLKTDAAASRTIRFTSKELEQMVAQCRNAMPNATKRKVHDALEHVMEAATKALEQQEKEAGIRRVPAAERLYQFKITLKGIEPPIWRRIQVKDCTLDRLHEHIQTAMGWTNSHLHQFKIGGVCYGDPDLIYEGWEEEDLPVNSLCTKVSKIVPQDGKRFRFDYEYDFGDGWEHEVLFEGCLRAEKGTRYPLCVEGQRACPPEDVGGVDGYQQYLETLSDPENEEWDEMSNWRGPYCPEHFDAEAATKTMRRRLPNWRETE
ncbi:MAG: plasmid pRiA4b ORF-3 family protein [Pirellulaceae bacterium]